jgi:hypothetical protein
LFFFLYFFNFLLLATDVVGAVQFFYRRNPASMKALWLSQVQGSTPQEKEEKEKEEVSPLLQEFYRHRLFAVSCTLRVVADRAGTTEAPTSAPSSASLPRPVIAAGGGVGGAAALPLDPSEGVHMQVEVHGQSRRMSSCAPSTCPAAPSANIYGVSESGAEAGAGAKTASPRGGANRKFLMKAGVVLTAPAASASASSESASSELAQRPQLLLLPPHPPPAAPIAGQRAAEGTQGAEAVHKPPMLRAALGSVFTAIYYLQVRCPLPMRAGAEDGAVAAVGVGTHCSSRVQRWQSSDCSSCTVDHCLENVASSSSSSPPSVSSVAALGLSVKGLRDVVQLTQGAIADLRVRVTETRDWLAAGSSSRVLTAWKCAPVPVPVPVVTDAADAGRERAAEAVEVCFELVVKLVPVTLGLVPLPPLQVRAL